jgi:hypothetical protein
LNERISRKIDCRHSNLYNSGMQDADRFQLLYGPYRAPRFRYGATVACQAYGLVKIVGVTSARIRPVQKSGKRLS